MKKGRDIRKDSRILIKAQGDDGISAIMKNEKNEEMRIIASWGGGWDHVSASYYNRVPTWDEMCILKDVFFEKEECAMQLHPPESNYKNHMPYCLHIWRPQEVNIPQPPLIFV